DVEARLARQAASVAVGLEAKAVLADRLAVEAHLEIPFSRARRRRGCSGGHSRQHRHREQHDEAEADTRATIAPRHHELDPGDRPARPEAPPSNCVESHIGAGMSRARIRTQGHERRRSRATTAATWTLPSSVWP